MRVLLIAVTAFAGCTSIVGIGDLPALQVDDAPGASTGDAPACADTTTDLDHCGSCDTVCPTVPGAARTCEQSLCRLDVDEVSHAIWTLTAPGPYLAFWRDGTLLTGSGGASMLISPGDSPSVTPFTTLAGRPTIVIPADPASDEIVIAHYGAFDAFYQSNTAAWTNGIHGCCGSSSDGFAVNPVLERMFTGHGVTELRTDTGETVSATDTFDGHGSPFFVTATALYLPRRTTAVVKKIGLNHAEIWSRTISDDAGVQVGEAAIAPDGGIIVATAAGDKLSRLLPNGNRAWELDVTAPRAPITTSSGLVVIVITKNAAPHLCAFDIETGAERWCTPVDGAVVDALAGDDGVIYTAIENTPTIFGYDAASGALRYTFRNVPAPSEMILRDHRLYLGSSGTVTAIQVPAGRYDASSWPVRYHDNQRTRGTQQVLDF